MDDCSLDQILLVPHDGIHSTAIDYATSYYLFSLSVLYQTEHVYTRTYQLMFGNSETSVEDDYVYIHI